ncbi:hypothetical protein HMPREF0765_1425 [Sphingobacterium spiritivorum ATCC 33300]|uniref:Uncharacterized protein n=1 Tax=Sphingobacterium spiritivorum ATCC 33300 TaxID=525372 RepID=C2FVR9_SPHSI|nr:hypothetical protein HMPREF0765_1425 [Sphingobacterium spiritivorum ATCC 33300]
MVIAAKWYRVLVIKMYNCLQKVKKCLSKFAKIQLLYVLYAKNIPVFIKSAASILQIYSLLCGNHCVLGE